ncbi:hypothetical protein OOK31_17470 [Streptomyces sp. NBC_00249]|uniref:hypothetical protein n=1 Tax=Streptomyces sp. NBC_00249 TaxID=2975690 RepID=UPI002255AF03|nr:hypothetical protein [Streptomyces sp. NBC_00249]MCX5195673.1 hypothetical protein [Streptomyces sp. NBC_00249]
MSRLTEALWWNTGEAVISLFAAAPSAEPSDLAFDISGCTPDRIDTYHLEDVEEVLTGLQVVEYDLAFDVLPAELGPYLEQCLQQVCARGARVAWLGFEGSFHFDHLLTEDTAQMLYGVAASGEPTVLALDDALRTGPEWPKILAVYRSKLLTD